MNFQRCPKCGKDSDLYRNVMVVGWQGVMVQANGDVETTGDHGEDWRDVEPENTYGCSCGWEGHKRDLVRIGWDGEPLVDIHPQQQRLT